MNEDTEYKDAFDAAAQPAVETAEEPALRGSEANLADGTALQQTNAADNKAAAEAESNVKMDEMGKLASATAGLSAHAQSAANAVGSGPDMADQFRREFDSFAEAERRK